MPVPRLVTSADKLYGFPGLPATNVSVGDFWQWAMADLGEDYVKGFVAEWIVAHLLGIPLTRDRRRLWSGDCDLQHPCGLLIEVKATSYWYSGRVVDHYGVERRQPRSVPEDSKIQFRVAPTRPERGATPTYKAHYYVFCFQHEHDRNRWDALDVSQWEFYWLKREELVDRGRKSISLIRLRKIFKERFGKPQGLTPSELQSEMGRILAVRAV